MVGVSFMGFNGFCNCQEVAVEEVVVVVVVVLVMVMKLRWVCTAN